MPVCIERITQNLVGDAGKVRQQFRDFGATLAVLCQLPGLPKSFFRRPICETILDVALVLFSVAFGQFGLRIEEIHVRGSAMHEQRNHRGGLGRRLRRARFKSWNLRRSA